MRYTDYKRFCAECGQQLVEHSSTVRYSRSTGEIAATTYYLRCPRKTSLLTMEHETKSVTVIDGEIVR